MFVDIKLTKSLLREHKFSILVWGDPGRIWIFWGVHCDQGWRCEPIMWMTPADISRVQSESSGEKFGGKISITQWDLLQMSMCPSRRHNSVAVKLSVKIEGILITMNIWCENGYYVAWWENLFLCLPFFSAQASQIFHNKNWLGLISPPDTLNS